MDGLFCITAMLRILLILLCCSVYCEDTREYCQDRVEKCECDVTGNIPPTKNSFPYVVSLQWKTGESNDHLCSGTLITAQKVLTAGRCAIKSDEGMYWAVAGECDLTVVEGTEQRRRVVEQIVHQKYYTVHGVHHNDVAVFLLYSPFLLTEYVQTVSVAREPLPGKEMLTVAGWGSVRDDPAPHLPVLHYVNRNTQAADYCSDVIGEPIDNLTVCTLSVLEGPCLGDSGSGAVHNGVVYGVVSWIYLKCNPHGGYSMVMSVYGYRDFITNFS
ncbi:putative trypsin-6 [Schistocerca americana]|uniref:putative trypsin-6 n=1 Tax=Schistocerca americana TaxID=7009 RepID=UPI001F4FFBC0|nr:putative trypsin-6 [Schistocerca americana]